MLLYHHWLQLSITTRHAIAAQFGFVKKGSTEVFNNTIKSDGFMIQDIEQALNIDAIQKFLNTDETDMAVLWNRMIAKIEGRVPANEVAAVVSEPTTFNGKTLPFCNNCDSKGVRHKKVCTRIK